jgi:flagellar basal body-associated protein FliL
VIAPQLQPQPSPDRNNRGRTLIRARDAARRRTQRARLRGYAMLARIVLGVTVLLVPIMGYVLMMGNLTAMNYALAQANEQKTELQEETMRLDDRIAALQSRDRLADVALKLHMHDPHVYAVVDLPRPVVTPAPDGIAFLGSLFHR